MTSSNVVSTTSAMLAMYLLAAMLMSVSAAHKNINNLVNHHHQAVDDHSDPTSRWVLISVEPSGLASIVAAREVEGPPSACTSSSASFPTSPERKHRDHYITVEVHHGSMEDQKQKHLTMPTDACFIEIKDPRLHFYEPTTSGVKKAEEEGQHHHHHADDHNHHAHSQIRKSSFALRVPLGVVSMTLTSVNHDQASSSEETVSYHEAVVTLEEEKHTLRRTATTLENQVVTIPTSQLEVTAAQVVGNPSQQFNIILVSSGYRGNEQRGYFDDYDSVDFLTFLRNQSTETSIIPTPFDIYYSTFNIYRVWFSSDEFGASKPSAGISVQNNLACSYGPVETGNLACDPNLVLLAASHAPPDPTRSLVVVLVRDDWAGGSGGGGIAVFATQPPANRWGTALHQLGHAWAGVSDEYIYNINEAMRVPMKNCHYMSYNTPWQAYIDNYVVGEAKLGCTFNNYYGPTGGKCVMANDKYVGGFCPVCRFFTLDAMYSKGMKLVSPTYPNLDERVYVSSGANVDLYINQAIPNMINGYDGTNRFTTTWSVSGSDVAFNTHTYGFSRVVTGDYVVNVTVRDRTTIILDQDRQSYETRGGNGPTAILQVYSFRVTVLANAATSGCSSKVAGPFGTQYCAICDPGKSCTYVYTATPINSVTVYRAELAGLKMWMVAIGIVFVVVGVLIFVVAWRLMNAHQENSPVEILPLTDNILIVRGVLIGVQILVLLIATFTIIYCVYQYGQLTIFGQSILLGVIACAVVVWLGSYLGVVAAYYKSRSLLFVNFILLLLLFGCVLLFSILLVYVLTNVENSGVIDQLQSEWQSAVEGRPNDVCDLENYMQCSGFNFSCSSFARTAPGGSTDCPRGCASNINTNPCLYYIQTFVKDHFGAASAGGWVLTALLLTALILSVLLGCAIKNQRNTVHRDRRIRHATGQNILGDEEIAMLRKEFNKIDKDGSGDISREEFSLFYNAVMGTDLSLRELEEYFDKLDADGNGNLSFEEFLKVYVPHREPRRKSMIKPKNVVEISSSSSSEDDEVEEMKPNAGPPPPGRGNIYENHDEDFQFDRRSQQSAPPPPPPGRTQAPGLNVSNQSSQPTQRGGGRGASSQPTPQVNELRVSNQSSQPSGYRSMPPPQQNLNISGQSSQGRGRQQPQQAPVHQGFDDDFGNFDMDADGW